MKEEKIKENISKEEFVSLRNEINIHMNWVSSTFLLMLYSSLLLWYGGLVLQNALLVLLPIFVVSASLLWIKEQMNSIMIKASYIRTYFPSENWEKYMDLERTKRDLSKTNIWDKASGDSKVISLIGIIIILISTYCFGMFLDYSVLKIILLMTLSMMFSYYLLIKNILMGYSIKEKKE